MIKKVRKSYNTLKWVLGIMLFVVAFLVVSSWHLSRKFKPIFKKQVKELVLNATDSLYHIEFSDISTNFITGGASLIDVKIRPDTNVFNKMVALKTAPNNIYYIQLKKLTIKNFHPRRLLKHNKVNIDVLLFDNPEVVMINKHYDFNEDKVLPQKTAYDFIAKYITKLRVKVVDFKNISFKYVNKNLPRTEVDSIKDLNITLKDWLIDKTSASDPSRFYFLKDIAINLNNYRYATPDSLYHINLNELNFKASSGKLNVKSFSVEPRYSEMKFAAAAGYAKERFNIQMSDMSMEGIDFPLYLRKQELYAKEMSITNGFIEVFTSNLLSKRTEIKTGRFPQQLLQKVRGLLTVRQLNLDRVDIGYSAFDKVNNQKGRITFEKMSGMITNITNSPKVKAKSPYMFANLTSYLMGQGKLNVKFKFDLNAKDGAFSYNGVLEQMDGRALNRITKPLGKVQIKSGMVKKLEFDIRANDHVATGSVKFAFNDLSIALLKKEKDRLVKQGLMSILANAMIINSDNPNAEGVMIGAPIHYEHVKTASFFNFIWRTLFQGIKYSMGMTPEKEKKIKAQIARFEKIKADRELRRAEREKRRIQRENK